MDNVLSILNRTAIMLQREIRSRKIIIDKTFTINDDMFSVQLHDLSSIVDQWKVQYGEDAVFTVDCDYHKGLECSIHYKSIETQKEYNERVDVERKRLAGLQKGKKNRRALYERLKKEFEGE